MSERNAHLPQAGRGCRCSCARDREAAGAERKTGKELTALLGEGKELNLGGPGKGYAGSLILSADGTGRGQIKLDNGDVIPIEGV